MQLINLKRVNQNWNAVGSRALLIVTTVSSWLMYSSSKCVCVLSTANLFIFINVSSRSSFDSVHTHTTNESRTFNLLLIELESELYRRIYCTYK